jgi:hypothetical protein
MRMSKRWAMPMTAAAVGAALLASGPALAAGAAPAHHSPAGRPSAQRVEASGGYSPIGGRLYSVSATSPSYVWAVGLGNNGSLIQHWNGKAWSTALNDSSGDFLYGVAARYWNDAWAVGGTNWGSPSSTLIYHWNGSSWRVVPSPSPGIGGYLQDVVATSRTNAWAVGVIAPGGPGIPSDTTPLIEHWNGKKWQVQQPIVPAGGAQFRFVAATSAHDVWAVGWIGGNGAPGQTLIEHWNGKSWKIVRSPNPPGESYAALQGISAISPTNAWVVGSANDGAGNATLIEHWNGKVWKIVASPTPDGDDALNAVSAVSARNVWAVGMTNPAGGCESGGPNCATLIEHWNGKVWSVVPSPNPDAALNALLGVFSFYRNGFAVGSTNYASTLVLRYNGKNWS